MAMAQWMAYCFALVSSYRAISQKVITVIAALWQYCNAAFVYRPVLLG